MTTKTETEAICCPEFNPTLWDDKILVWDKKKFVKDKVCTFFYMPMNFGKVITKLNNKLDKAGAKCFDWLCLSDHTSKWNMDIYVAVDKAKNITLSGKFYSKVYEGDFKDTGKWCKDYDNVAKSKGIKTKKMYMWYTTCTKCAKKYGKNYVAIVAEVE
jgi:hypothetical protein